ncbi:hypothetical protein DFH09DRAFT_1272992 [Mycena vulgaris]|nr:hypothetical protein DFH09DRAFT_1272992 [Mycena vulgaris]
MAEYEEYTDSQRPGMEALGVTTFPARCRSPSGYATQTRTRIQATMYINGRDEYEEWRAKGAEREAREAREGEGEREGEWDGKQGGVVHRRLRWDAMGERGPGRVIVGVSGVWRAVAGGRGRECLRGEGKRAGWDGMQMAGVEKRGPSETKREEPGGKKRLGAYGGGSSLTCFGAVVVSCNVSLARDLSSPSTIECGFQS